MAVTLKTWTQPGDRGQQAMVINVATLVVSVFVALRAWTLVDLALSANAIVNRKPKQTASAVVSAPAPPAQVQPAR